MNLNRFKKLAEDAIEKRGGVDAIKQDLMEAKRATSGKGSLKDKAKAAAESLKEPNRTRPPETPPHPQP